MVSHRLAAGTASLLLVEVLTANPKEIPPGNFSYLGHTCCDITAANPFNAPVVEAPSSWVINNTVNLGYAANWYADASKCCFILASPSPSI